VPQDTQKLPVGARKNTTAPLHYETALYCTVLYCTVLHCTALYCNVFNSTAMYCAVAAQGRGKAAGRTWEAPSKTVKRVLRKLARRRPRCAVPLRESPAGPAR